MKNRYIFLRHAETIKDPAIHPKDWSLTPDALKKIEEYLKKKFFAGVTKIITSGENKAYSTGVPVANSMGINVEQMTEFNEIGRSGKFLTDQEFLVQKKKQLTDLDTEVDGGESGRNALERFKSGIAKLESENEGQTFLIVSHGTVLTLYFAEQTGKWERIFDRWKRLPFCAIGLVEDNKVVKDLGQKSLVRHFKIGQH